MKCEFVSFDDGIISKVIIEVGKICINEGKEEQVLEIDSKTCFNTLISLFSLKEKWKKEEIVNPLYKVCFEMNGKIDVFEFEIDVPENWGFFMAYISRLVGEYL